MDWKGGRLRQSKRTSGPLNSKQKAYFARARANQGAGGAKPLYSVPEADEHHAQLGAKRSTRLALSENSPRQMRLDEFDAIAPIAKKLSSLRPRESRTASHLRSTTSMTISSSHRRKRMQPHMDLQIEKNNPAIKNNPVDSSFGFASNDLSEKLVECDQPLPLAGMNVELFRTNLINRLEWLKPSRLMTPDLKLASKRHPINVAKRRNLNKSDFARVRLRGNSPAPPKSNLRTPLRRSSKSNFKPVSIRAGTQIHGTPAVMMTDHAETEHPEADDWNKAFEKVQYWNPLTESQNSSNMLLDEDDSSIHSNGGIVYEAFENHHAEQENSVVNALVALASRNAEGDLIWIDKESSPPASSTVNKRLQEAWVEENYRQPEDKLISGSTNINVLADVQCGDVSECGEPTNTLQITSNNGTLRGSGSLGRHGTFISTAVLPSWSKRESSHIDSSTEASQKLSSIPTRVKSTRVDRGSSSTWNSLSDLSLKVGPPSCNNGRTKVFFRRPPRFTPPAQSASEACITIGNSLSRRKVAALDSSNADDAQSSRFDEQDCGTGDPSDPIES